MTNNEIRSILDRIDYKDWHFRLGVKGHVVYLQVVFWAHDTDSHGVPQKTAQKGRKWMLSRHMTESELVQTAFKAVLTAEEHEAREKFRYYKEPVFGPHFDVKVLWELAAGRELDIRQPMPNEDIELPENEVVGGFKGSALAEYLERKGFNRSGLICATDKDE